MTKKTTYRFIAVFTAVLLMCSVFTTFSGLGTGSAVYADTEVAMSGKATVVDGPLNVRSGPGTNYSRVSQLPKGTTVTIVAKTTNSSGNVWYKYQYKSGKYGYIYSQYVSVTAANGETALTNKKATVTDGPLNVRSGPGTNYSKLGKLAKGKSVTLVSQVNTSAGTVWYKYKYDSSRYGYIYSQYVSVSDISATAPVPTPTETALSNKQGIIKDNNLRVRSGPGTNYSILGKLQSGNKVTLISQVTNSSGNVWYKYQFKSGQYGYIYSQYVTVSDIPQNVETALTNKQAVVKDGPLNIRSGPGTNYSSLGKLQEGNKVTLISQVKNTSGNIWYKYQVSSGKYGYIYGQYVTVSDIPQLTETPLTNKQAVVKDNNLRIRSGPGTNYSILGKLQSGNKITLISKVTNTGGNVWYKFQHSSGKYGYIYGQHVTVSDIPQNVETALTNKEGLVVDDSLRIRSGPGTNYSVLGKLNTGDRVTLVSQIRNSGGNIWYKYQFKDGQFGYIYAQHVMMQDVSAAPETPDDTGTTPEPTEPSEPVTFELGTITTTGGVTLNVRSGPGTGYSKIGSLTSQSVVTIIGSEKASNGKVWYKYQYNASKVGYICSDYVSVKSVTSTSEFEAYLAAQGFPESYKPGLRALHAAHPTWVFKAYSVGCTWDQAVDKENEDPDINVVDPNLPKSYRSKDPDCYNSKTGYYTPYDGRWYSAHTDVIEHYMDPRNFLNETGIYQFMIHKYDGTTQNANTVASVVKGTFMETRSPGGGYSSYATLINDAGKASGVNPNVLAAMILQEQGTKGTSGLISGKYPGYEGYYNFFNVGAYKTSTMTAVERGLWYAKTQKGWNSVYKSIVGGAQFYANGYVDKNQYTYYTKKFNVKNGYNKIGSHQYMTNVSGAYSEGALLKKAFPANYNEPVVFEIPVYSSMPASACPLP